MPGMTLKFKKDSDIHRRLIKEISSRVKMAERRHQDQHEKWRRAEEMVVAYVPEKELDLKAQRARDRGEPQYTTIQIPYAYALLMAAHTYWTSVMLARSPIHQFSGRHGESEMSVQGLEALIAYQVQVGGMLAPYYLWLYDGGKYGTGIIGTYWDERYHQYSQLATDPTSGKDVYVTSRVRGYHGNRIYNVSPWDFLPDPRVPVGRFQEGEFCAVKRRPSWNDLVLKEKLGYYMNLDQIKTERASHWYKTGDEGHLNRPAPLEEVEILGTERKKHPAWVGVYEVYITLIPNEWDLGSMDLPEKWVFTVTGDCELILGAQPLGMLHDRYPFDVIEPEPEAYGLWNRGIPETIQPIQEVMDWLVNTHFYNVRAISNGRFIYDPSKIDATPLKKNTPGYMLALRPSAYGTDVRAAFTQIPAVDPTQTHFNDFNMMLQVGERMIGINEQMLGVLSGGGRKTATEVRTSTGFGVNRLKTTSEYISAVGMASHAQMLVQNCQQLQEEEIRVKIVGDLARFERTPFVNVDPSMIAGFYDFVPVDGSLPIDRFAQATLWKDIMGQIRQFPDVANTYDLAKIFAWVSSLAGVKNVDQFRRDVPGVMPQVMPDEQLAMEAQRGNIVPMRPGPQGTSANAPNIPVTM